MACSDRTKLWNSIKGAKEAIHELSKTIFDPDGDTSFLEKAGNGFEAISKFLEYNDYGPLESTTPSMDSMEETIRRIQSLKQRNSFLQSQVWDKNNEIARLEEMLKHAQLNARE